MRQDTVFYSHLAPAVPDRFVSSAVDASAWILIPPNGSLAMLRYPATSIPSDARLATATELLAANRGNPFPWGARPEPHPSNRHWTQRRIGVGGLIHNAWFMTADGRFGGAPNVPETTPGSLRCCMFLDGGGGGLQDPLLENEGYCIVRNSTDEDCELFRRVQLYAAKHVMADGGGIVISPICPDRKVFVGFVGRCQICPSLELISFPQLRQTISDYDFQLWAEWQGWSLRGDSNGAEVRL